MDSSNSDKFEVRRKVVPIEELIGVIQDVLTNGKTFCITITGASMTPFLYHLRDQVIFAPLDNRVIRKGDILFYQRDNGQYVMHRVYSVDKSGVMTFVGDAQDTLEPGIRPDQLRAYVTQVIRKKKVISCEKGFWRNLMTTYMDMRIDHPRITKFVYHVVRYSYKLITDPAGVIRFLKRVLGKN